MSYWSFYTHTGIFMCAGIKSISANYAVEMLRKKNNQEDKYFDRYYEIDEVIASQSKIIFKKPSKR